MRDPVQIVVLILGAVLLGLWWTNLPDAPAPAETTQSQGTPAPTTPSGTLAEATSPVGSENAPARVPPPRSPALSIERVVLDNGDLRLQISNQNGRIESAQLLGFKDRLGDEAGPVELVTDPENGMLVVTTGRDLVGDYSIVPRALEVIRRSSTLVALETTQDGLYERRTLSLDDEGFGAELRVVLENRGSTMLEPNLQLNFFGAERDVDAPDYFQNYQLVAAQAGDLERRMVRGIGSPGFFRRILGGASQPTTSVVERPVAWAGIESQYFLAAALTDSPDRNVAQQIPVGANSGSARLSLEKFPLPPGTRVERGFKVYFGPKVEAEVVAVDEALMPAVNVGWNWVRPIVVAFARGLRWSYENIIPNYGVGIILLTILLRVATYPLTQKSMKSMKRFGEIAPVMKELQEKHGDDRERLQQEMMRLYKEKGVNPFSALGGGCLPMLIQMPFMIALYFALQGSIELRHAPFALWIQDLSAPENFLSIAGLPIRPLPLLMGGSMLLQQRLGPQTADPQQRQMMMWMSVVFTFMFYRFPSGLLLYWFVSNLLGIAQQLWVNREAKAS